MQNNPFSLFLGETTTLATRNAADLLNPQDEIVLKVHDEITTAEDGTQKVHVQTEGDDGQQYVLVLEQNPSENEGEFLTGIVPQILTKMREDR